MSATRTRTDACSGIIDGILIAAQFMAVQHKEGTLAEDILVMSGKNFWQRNDAAVMKAGLCAKSYVGQPRTARITGA